MEDTEKPVSASENVKDLNDWLPVTKSRNAKWCYSAISWIACIHKEVQPDADYGSRFATPSGKVFGFFSAIGDVSFAFAGHNVVLQIQASIPSTPEKPSNKPMWKGALIAYIVVALCYFPVAMFGY
ncbi:hypothetical protein Pint_15646 [Pistacia integerrima]|uniref:Uncharacterized protein n=1 Tax=Pistacia integerrima TaxID=434235 RepID=A0ACC0ZEE1_9ROSI|nr:hypothetical protein Pint_15646 [Pistacia integerrima]